VKREAYLARSAPALAVLVLGLAVAAGCGGKSGSSASGAAAAAAPGSLKQLDGTGGCISETGSAGACGDGKGLDGARAVAISADGKNVYAASSNSYAVAIFARNPVTGQLAQLSSTAGCVSETGSAGACADGKALSAAISLAVSADAKNVYVASPGSDAVAVFSRDPMSGKLAQLGGTAGCVSETGAGPCADGKALKTPNNVAVSSDGKNVYVASAYSDAIAVFTRHLPTGQLRQLPGATGLTGCVSETGSGPCADGKGLDGARTIAVSSDGKSVYAGSELSKAVAVFARDATTGSLAQLAGDDGCVSETGSGPCADGKALDYPLAIAVSADGKNVYVVSDVSQAVAVFKRNTMTGKLTQLAGTDGCVSSTGAGGCAAGEAIDHPIGLAVSADGKHVYVSSAHAVAAFARDLTTGKLTQLAGTDGCVSDTGSGGACAVGKALDVASAAAVSADGKNVYVASFNSDAVAVFTRQG
jgi:DNA-binding beta-propeller fold protein YncE